MTFEVKTKAEINHLEMRKKIRKFQSYSEFLHFFCNLISLK